MRHQISNHFSFKNELKHVQLNQFDKLAIKKDRMDEMDVKVSLRTVK
jgi:hypothetical protein